MATEWGVDIMLNLIPKPALIGVCVAALVGLYGYGFHNGKAAAQNRYLKDMEQARVERDQKAEALRVTTSAWLTERESRAKLEEAFDDQARQDPNGARICLSGDSLLRLKAVH